MRLLYSDSEQAARPVRLAIFSQPQLKSLQPVRTPTTTPQRAVTQCRKRRMRRRDMRTWHIMPKEGWYGAVGRAKQSQSAMVAGTEALEQGCKWWLRTLQ
jgi:hypothetical protein